MLLVWNRQEEGEREREKKNKATERKWYFPIQTHHEKITCMSHKKNKTKWNKQDEMKSFLQFTFLSWLTALCHRSNSWTLGGHLLSHHFTQVFNWKRKNWKVVKMYQLKWTKEERKKFTSVELVRRLFFEKAEKLIIHAHQLKTDCTEFFEGNKSIWIIWWQMTISFVKLVFNVSSFKNYLQKFPSKFD